MNELFSLFIGGCCGFVLTIPPGPVASYTLETTLRVGYRAGRRVALGVAIVDTVFCLGVLFASSAIIQWGVDLAEQHSQVALVTKYTIVVGILAAGVFQMIRPSNVTTVSPVHLETHVSGSKPILVGAATALSNAFNPTFLPSLTAIITSISAAVPGIAVSGADRLLFAGGFGAGTYLWLHAVTNVVRKHHGALSPTLMKLIRRIGGFIFALFALWILWKMSA
ncbi:MAG: LysE family translocator [Candidatus Kapaibacterium sp.]|jgi:threonine/homoserine/homoserine lactone efflux protein